MCFKCYIETFQHIECHNLHAVCTADDKSQRTLFLDYKVRSRNIPKVSYLETLQS